MRKYVLKRDFAPAVRRIAYTIPEQRCFEISRWNISAADNYATPANPTADDATKAGVAFKMLSLVNPIQVGTGNGQRIGYEIFVRYIQITLDFKVDGDQMLNAHVMRYGVMLNLDSDNALPAAATIFANGANTAGVPAYDSLRNFYSRQKFRTLLDKQWKCVATGVNGTTGAALATTGSSVITHYIPINKKVRYTAANNDLSGTNINMNNIMFYSCASVADCCTAKMYLKVVYNDA